MPLSQRLNYQISPLDPGPSNSGNLESTSPPMKQLPSSKMPSATGVAPLIKQEPAEDSVVDEVCLRWNSHHSNMKTALPNILGREHYVDCTLAAEGKKLKCHRVSYFVIL